MAHPDPVEVPKTIHPWGEFFWWNGWIFLALWTVISLLFYPLLDLGPLWAFFVTIAIFGGMVAGGTIAGNMEDWHAAVAFNPFTRRRRAIFQGFFVKLPWEKLEEPIPLRRDISKEATFSLATNDPTETMDVTILLHMRTDTSGTPEEAAKKLQHRESIEDEAVAEVVFGEIVKMFGEYYGDGEMENLLKLSVVQKTILSDPTNNDRLHELGEQYGMHIEVILKKSNPDERTKRLKETPARAEALNTAMEKLDQGLSPERRLNASLLLDDTAEYSETHNTWDVNINAHGLENLHDVNILPPGTLGGGQPGKKRGGEKK